MARTCASCVLVSSVHLDKRSYVQGYQMRHKVRQRGKKEEKRKKQPESEGREGKGREKSMANELISFLLFMLGKGRNRYSSTGICWISESRIF